MINIPTRNGYQPRSDIDQVHMWPFRLPSSSQYSMLPSWRCELQLGESDTTTYTSLHWYCV